jgi:hypothetical protein
LRTQKNFGFIFLIGAFITLILSGCGKNEGILGPNSMNRQVSFTVSQQNGYYGGTQFLFRPSVDIKINRIISKYTNQQFADTISYGNQNYIYSKDTTYIINEYSGVQNGQQWIFDFTGSIPAQNNSNYNVTTNYTVQ